jgi:hypothetical protein
VINIWIDHFHQLLHKEACILSQTDSTTALGWLEKSNFADMSEELVQLSTARKVADIILESETCLFSQWTPISFSGADSLWTNNTAGPARYRLLVDPHAV